MATKNGNGNILQAYVNRYGTAEILGDFIGTLPMDITLSDLIDKLDDLGDEIKHIAMITPMVDLVGMARQAPKTPKKTTKKKSAKKSTGKPRTRAADPEKDKRPSQQAILEIVAGISDGENDPANNNQIFETIVNQYELSPSNALQRWVRLEVSKLVKEGKIGKTGEGRSTAYYIPPVVLAEDDDNE